MNWETDMNSIRSLRLFCAIVCIWLAWQFCQTNIHADSFFPTGEIDNCQFASTIGVQYQNPGIGVNFNAGSLQGESGNWLQNKTMNDVADISFPDARRYPGVADSVSVPPNTKVEVGLFAWNYSGHTIGVQGIELFTSRTDPSLGDLTRIGAGGRQGEIRFDQNSKTRLGKKVSTGPLGTYQNRVHTGGRIFYSFTTIQPIQLVSRSVTPVKTGANLKLNYSLTLRNSSTYNVCGLKVLDNLPNGINFQQDLCLNANETKTINYEADLGTNYGTSISISPATIQDNNYYREHSGSKYSSPNAVDNYEARTAYVWRNDSSAPSWSGLQPSWGQAERNLISVEIIPYSFSTTSTTVFIAPDLTISKLVSDSDEQNVQSNTANAEEVLNYTIQLKNNGPRLSGIKLLDIFPNEFFEVAELGDAALNPDNTMQWNLGSLDPGAEVSFTPRLKLKRPQTIGDHIVTNKVIASWGDYRVEAATQSQVHYWPKLEVQKTLAGLNPALAVNPNQILTYILSYRNTGNISTSVTLKDTINKHVILKTGEKFQIITANAVDLPVGWELVENPDSLGFISSPFNLPVSSDWQSISMAIKLADLNNLELAGDKEPRLITNILSISADNPQVDPNSSSVSVVVEQPLLVITKTAQLPGTQSSISDQSLLTYYITLENKGSANASDIIVSDKLDHRLSFKGFLDSLTHSYDPNQLLLNWNIPNLAAGDKLTLQFSVMINAGLNPKELSKISNFVNLQETTGIDISSNIDEINVIGKDDQAQSQNVTPKFAKTGDSLENFLGYYLLGMSGLFSLVLVPWLPKLTRLQQSIRNPYD